MTQTARSSDTDRTEVHERVAVGRVRKPTGTHGSLSVTMYSGDTARLPAGTQVVVGGEPHTVSASRPGTRGDAILTLESVSSREEALKFRGAEIEMEASDLPQLPQGVYYHYQLIGCSVATSEGKTLGKVIEILETGGNDVYVVSDQEHEVLIPVVRDVVISIDVGAGKITVDLPKGLAD